MGGHAAEPSNLFSHTCATARPGSPTPRGVLGATERWSLRVLMPGGCGPLQVAPPLPLRSMGIRLSRQVQRLDVGRWTGYSGVFSGSVCLRNSPRPRESWSHLSGSSRRERGSGVLACRRAGRLGGGGVSLINISPSGFPMRPLFSPSLLPPSLFPPYLLLSLPESCLCL